MKGVAYLTVVILAGIIGCTGAKKDVAIVKENIPEAKLKVYVDSCWNHKNIQVVKSLVTDDFVRNLNGIDVANGPLELEAHINIYFKAFPNLEIQLDDIYSQDQTVIATWTFTGTNTAEFAEFAATGKKTEVNGVTILKFNEEGKMVREDTFYNELYLLQQLGYSLKPPNLE